MQKENVMSKRISGCQSCGKPYAAPAVARQLRHDHASLLPERHRHGSLRVRANTAGACPGRTGGRRKSTPMSMPRSMPGIIPSLAVSQGPIMAPWECIT